MIEAVADLHLLRPAWLWALLALPLLAWTWQRRRRRDQVWRNAVDPQLLPHLLDGSATRHGLASLVVQCLAWTLAVLALAGPSWRSGEQTLQPAAGTPLVLALDLSQAALAGDLPPSRLLQARARIASLLGQRNGEPTALVAYADDAFTVAPLSEDTANIALFVDALAPDIMPVEGSRASRAIEHGVRLLARGGHAHGDILLLAGDVDGDAIDAAAPAVAAGHRVSVLGMGTAAGAAYRRSDGDIAQARLDVGALQALAAAGGGRYIDWNGDALAVLSTARTASGDATASGVRMWRDEGYWLLLPLMLLGLFAFRRGAAVAVLAGLLCLPMLPAHAAGEGSMWRRADQAQHARLREGVDAYRAGDDAAALRAWQDLPGATAAYNRGNALARQGRYPEAIAAYDEALRVQPGMDDAIANRRAVEAAMQRRPPSGGGRQDNRADGDDAGTPPPEGQGDAGTPGQGAPPQGVPPGEGAPPPEQGDDGDDKASPQPGERDPPADGPAPDAAGQQAADDAQRERIEQALRRQAQAGGDQSDDAAAPADAASAAERERRQANEAWLQRIPDDPGGLLRAKFRLEHDRRNGIGSDR
jgi:Ca-activated chloride channel homolog